MTLQVVGVAVAMMVCAAATTGAQDPATDLQEFRNRLLGLGAEEVEELFPVNEPVMEADEEGPESPGDAGSIGVPFAWSDGTFRSPSADSWYDRIQISGAARWRFESHVNYPLKTEGSFSAPSTITNEDFALVNQRLRIDLTADLNERASVSLGLLHASEFGGGLSGFGLFGSGPSHGDLFGNVHPYDPATSGWMAGDGAGDLALHTAFMTLDYGHAELRLGRQPITLGSGRLVGEDEWLTRPRTFDALRWTKHVTNMTDLDVFAAVVNGSHLSAAGTGLYDNQSIFAGVHLGCKCWFTKGGVQGRAELFGYVLEQDAVEGFDGTPQFLPELSVVTLGFRHDLTVKLRDGELGLDIELASQFGETGGATGQTGDNPQLAGDINDAMAVAVEMEWTRDTKYLSRIGVGLHYATGDDLDTTDTIEGFNILFPSSHGVFGLMDAASWSNIEHFTVGGTLMSHDDHQLDLGYHILAAADADSPVFGIGMNGSQSALGAPGGDGSLGQELDLVWRGSMLESLGQIEVGGGYFFDSAPLAVYGEDSAAFVYVQVEVRF